MLSIPSSPSLDGHPFRVSVTGNVHFTTPGADNFALVLYKGTSTTVASNTKLTSSADAGQFNNNAHFYLYADVVWDSTSQRISGQVGGTTISDAVWTTGLTPVSSISSQSSLQFVLTSRFTTGTAGNSVTITEFKASVL